MSAKPHEDPNCKCKACEEWYAAAKHAENTAAAGRDFRSRLFGLLTSLWVENRHADAAIVSPIYARACGIVEHTVFQWSEGPVEVLFDVNVPGHDIYCIRKAEFFSYEVVLLP